MEVFSNKIGELQEILGRMEGSPSDQEALMTARAALDLAAAAVAASVDTKCTIGGEAEADVYRRPHGQNDEMIERCKHKKAHCWDGAGNLIRCP